MRGWRLDYYGYGGSADETRAACLSISVYLVGRVATAEPVAQDGAGRVECGELLDGG